MESGNIVLSLYSRHEEERVRRTETITGDILNKDSAPAKRRRNNILPQNDPHPEAML